MYVCTTSTARQSGHNILPEAELVVGVTSLPGVIFVLRLKERDQVEVYDVNTYNLRKCLTVPNARSFIDMTSCECKECVYIADHVGMCIHKVNSQDQFTRWPVSEVNDARDEPRGLSVNKAHNVLVTCPAARKIKEFSSDGTIVREITLPDEVVNPLHAIQLTSGQFKQFIVCHGEIDDPVNRVCIITENGSHIVHSHGGQPGSDVEQYRGPRHLAVDNGFVFVADINNRRVTLLSSTLDYIGQFVTDDQFKGDPQRLHVDKQKRLLYVADDELTDGKYTAGRVLVFSI